MMAYGLERPCDLVLDPGLPDGLRVVDREGLAAEVSHLRVGGVDVRGTGIVADSVLNAVL